MGIGVNEIVAQDYQNHKPNRIYEMYNFKQTIKLSRKVIRNVYTKDKIIEVMYNFIKNLFLLNPGNKWMSPCIRPNNRFTINNKGCWGITFMPPESDSLTTLHVTTLHVTTLHVTTLHVTTLHVTTLHVTTLHTVILWLWM